MTVERRKSMTVSTPEQLFDRAFRLYREEKYAEAFDLLTREGARFPDCDARVQFWRACLASRAGETEQSLSILQAAVDAGYWYSEHQLRRDDDLEPLWNLPEYERLVDVCLDRFAAAQAETKPELVIVEPESGTSPWPLLIALHGNSSSAQASSEYWRPAVSAGWLVALPQSSLIGGPDEFVWNDWDLAEQEVVAHFEILQERYEIDEDRVVLGGFSMGAGAATWLALKGTPKARGFVAVAPYIPEERDVASLLAGQEAQSTRGYVVIGDKDEGCYPIAQTLTATLRDNGNQVELHEVAGLYHEYPDDFGQVLPQALDYVGAEA
jgi:predicted esterase